MMQGKKQIGAAILGLGEMGKVHVKAAKDSAYINKVIGYEPDASRALKRGNELGIEVTTALDDILSDKDISVVYIASPNEFHCQQTVKCLRAGKAVLCEKPMGLNLGEAREMLAAEEETGGYLQIGFELHFSKIYMLVKEWIDQGLIGQPLNTIFNYFCSEFHLKNSWRSGNKGCFLIGEKLSHYLDLPRWWIGEKVEEVYSISSPNFVKYFNHPDNHCIVYKFKNGATSSLNFVMGSAESSVNDPLQDMLTQQADDGHCLKYLIYGTKGAIETDVFRRRIRRWEFTDASEKMVSKIAETVTYESEKDLEWIHNVYGQDILVSEAVAGKKRPLTKAKDSFDTMKLVFAAEISKKENRIVKLSEL